MSLVNLPKKRRLEEPGGYPESSGAIRDLNEQNRSFKRYFKESDIAGFPRSITAGAVFSDRSYLNLFPCPWMDGSHKMVVNRDLLFIVNAPADKKTQRGGKYVTLAKLNNLMDELHRKTMAEWDAAVNAYGANHDWKHPMEWVQHHPSSAWESKEFRVGWKLAFGKKIKDFMKFEIPYYVKKYISFVGVVVTGTTSNVGNQHLMYNFSSGSMYTSMVACCEGSIECFNFWGPELKQLQTLWIVFRRAIASGPILAVPMAAYDMPSIDQRGYCKKLDFDEPKNQPEFIESGYCLRIGLAMDPAENIQASTPVATMAGLTAGGKVLQEIVPTFSKSYLRILVDAGGVGDSVC